MKSMRVAFFTLFAISVITVSLEVAYAKIGRLLRSKSFWSNLGHLVDIIYTILRIYKGW